MVGHFEHGSLVVVCFSGAILLGQGRFVMTDFVFKGPFVAL
jgi:hypothetical protein